MPFRNTNLYELADKLTKLNEGIAFKTVFNGRKIKEEIIRLNTREQLYKKGINSEGVKLSSIGGEYSPVTLSLNPEKVKDRITLHDTGDFYDSWKIIVDATGITIDVDPIKDDTNLLTEWGDDVVGLTEESKEILKPYIIEAYKRYIIQAI